MKTKAKQRYLKVKRERRKKRKTAAAAAAEAVHKSNVKNKIKPSIGFSRPLHEERTNHSEEDKTSNYTEEETSDAEPSNIEESGSLKTSITPKQRPHVVLASPTKAERPRKRRKLVEKAQDTAEISVLDAASTVSRGSPPDEEAPSARKTADLVPLAAFPMPLAPPAASRKALTFQGLDPGLVEAEIVDSTRTIPIDSPDTGGTRASSPALSLKTRKCLEELGITEWFAGRSSIYKL